MAEQDSLEERISGVLPTLEEFTLRFSRRYHLEKTFQKMVHSYFRLSGLKKGAMATARALHLPWYKSETDRIIGRYATLVYEAATKARDVERKVQELKNAEQARQAHESEIEALHANEQDISARLYRTEEEWRQAINEANSEFSSKVRQEDQAVGEVTKEILEKTDANAVARGKIRDIIANSPLVSSNGDRLEFDEQAIMSRLEQIALNEIIEGIEAETRTGFMGRLRASYGDLITYWSEIEDLSELANVDWLQSTVYSRTQGYKVATFPFLVTGKSETRAKASVDTAMSVDVSGSMRERGRMAAAVKTAMAMNALMRQLNPGKEAYFSIYSNSLRPVTTKELRSISPDGSTHTERALEWLLDTLKDRGPGIAYLITDGRPNELKPSVKAAQQFQKYPYILLRVFLIDGDEAAQENIRQIGRAAGRYTRVLEVDSTRLGSGVIGDFAKSIGEMRNIEDF